MSLLLSTLPPPPPISRRTLPMAGLLVDVYGLSELPPAPAPDTTTTTAATAAPLAAVSCLWLHHPRGATRAYVADVAARCVGAWNRADTTAATTTTTTTTRRGLIALACDQRNHGSRLVDEGANGSWREGNAMHAVDMFGVVEGMVADQGVLMDLVEGYLFRDGPERKIDQHLALGVSLGGHSVWQLMFAEPRVTAGVVIVGCPDYMYLLSDRARLSGLPTYSAQDDGASFLGSRDFPPSLVKACEKSDPKAIFFGAGPIQDATAATPSDGARDVVHERLRGKKFLLCSGADDKLVPYRCAEPFLKWFQHATESWLKEENVSIDNRVYPGIGHSFSAEMITDSVQFVVDVVASADQQASPTTSGEQGPSKI
ncbi:hypothetical protein BT67DRAFT_128232 [Trichocladium antarcticum]|uniref:Uncharacterized protein n=1 Tax=Trichocladium antarcticum TaxID=1450529 RepID=A0AAN6US24_9PEZI|nr:hypothetical protein BT67DRAFT_128232 [Trichocladium antarcticum]